MPDEHAENTHPNGGATPPAVAPDPVERIKPYQWKRGQSGNPNGRPKGSSITSLLRQILNEEHNGRALKELLAERIITEALAGKFPYTKEVLDRLEGLPGKPQQNTDNTVRILVTDARGNQRPGTNDDIRNAAMPKEVEVKSLREFYTRVPGSPNAGMSGDTNGT